MDIHVTSDQILNVIGKFIGWVFGIISLILGLALRGIYNKWNDNEKKIKLLEKSNEELKQDFRDTLKSIIHFNNNIRNYIQGQNKVLEENIKLQEEIALLQEELKEVLNRNSKNANQSGDN